MKTTVVILTVLVILGAITPGCSRPATNSNTSPAVTTGEGRRIASVDVVKATPEETTISRGGSADALIRLKIDNGYHINANPPTFPYLKPTEVEITPAVGISVSFTTYPDPLVKKFPFAEQPLAVYEGDTLLKVRLKADNSISAGRKNLSGKLRVQACDEQVCYAPGAMDITLPVNVK